MNWPGRANSKEYLLRADAFKFPDLFGFWILLVERVAGLVIWLKRVLRMMASAWTDVQGEDSVALRPVFTAHGASVGQLQSEDLRVGGGILQGQTGSGQESCLCFALSGTTLVEDPLEDVANPHALRSRVSCPQPATHGSWVLQLNPNKA